MLRCPPSRVELTSSDVNDFERRFLARQTARQFHCPQGALRLSPGPSQCTSLTLIPEDHQDARNEAVPSFSQVTVCSTDDASLDACLATTTQGSSGVWTATTPSVFTSQPSDQSDLSAPWRGHTGPRHIGEGGPSAGGIYDGAMDARRPGPLTTWLSDTNGIHPEHAVNLAREWDRGGFATETPHRTIPSLLSSARARRRLAHSHDFAIPEDEPDIQRAAHSQYQASTLSHADRSISGLPFSLPELILPHPDETAGPIVNLALDPDAAVFVPRTRFGSVLSTLANQKPQWSSLDSSHSTSNLRLRSSSEQNVEHPVRHRPNVESHERARAQPRYQRRGRVSESDERSPNLERYPMLRPPSRPIAARRYSGAHRPIFLPVRNVSRGLAAASHHTLNGMPADCDGALSSDATESMDTYQGSYGNVLARSTNNSGGSSSRLQPPMSEPRLGSRSSSLAWAHPSASPTHHAPIGKSTTSGGHTAAPSRHSSMEGLNAAAEFLRMRSSPLDELTERLSRLAASRPRSVGRSWERSPGLRQRVSLLSGDPFRPDYAPIPRGERSSIGTSPENTGVYPPALDLPPISDSSYAEQAVDLPASSPSRVISSPLPNTPPARRPIDEVQSPRSPLKNISPGKASRTPVVTRKPVPVQSTAATPRVRVYNDAQSARTQPQTPADIGRSSRRARGGSDTMMGHVVQAVTPPALEHRPHRHTYPSATPRPEGPHESAVAITPATTAALPIQYPVRRSGRGTESRTQRSGENDIEGQLDLLEAGRRIWQHRQEAGSLDSTPPGEGRFERIIE
ncbi:hypothetical protein LTR53_004189 [Teratosphaeriaceae sp. CCFEE 6253]|nr:hypothetical protein LTR53_004189 [Teratosphaeriaceae sp. CCFEE 6253]